MTIASPSDWLNLRSQHLDVIVDPVIYRLGQIFLQGSDASGPRSEDLATALDNDIGSLVSFFDLIVLHDRLPAFNYTSTFDMGLNFDESLGALVNPPGTTVIVPVDVRWEAYSAAKDAALDQYRRRLAAGPLVGDAKEAEILSGIKAIEYQWEPDLQGLQNELADPRKVRLAQFMVGVLVFAGYAQQSGAAHVLSPRRSRLVTEAGLGDNPATTEADVYNELRRRFKRAGAGWRDETMPWTPSFLPWLLSQTNPYRDGPDVLLKRAMDLRDRPAVARYRRTREAALNETDPEHVEEARKELVAAADAAAKALDARRGALELTHQLMVEVLPKAMGVAAGVLIGGAVAGPPGAMAGGIAAVVGEEALRPVQQRLFGWVLDRLPYYSARKLLSRAVTVDARTGAKLRDDLMVVWETGPRHAL